MRRVAVSLSEPAGSVATDTAASCLGRYFRAQPKRLPYHRTAPSPNRWSGWRMRNASGGRLKSDGTPAEVTQPEQCFERTHRMPRPRESGHPFDTEGAAG